MSENVHTQHQHDLPDPMSLETLAQIEVELKRATDSVTGERSENFRVARLYRRAAELPPSNNVELARFLVEYLVPDCYRLYEPDTPDRSVQRSSMREILSDWLNTLPEPALWRIRQSVIECISAALLKAPSKDALYTLSAVGYRDEQTVKLLRLVAHQNDDVGDIALRLLISMGSDGDELNWVRDRIRTRYASGAKGEELKHAIAQLGGRDAIEMLSALGQHDQEDWFLFSRFAWVCDAAPGDRSLQDQAWDAATDLASRRAHGWRQLVFMGGMIGKCHTPRVIKRLSSELPTILSQIDAHRLGVQFEGIVSPCHTEAVADGEPPPGIESLRSAAVRSSGPSTVGMTAEAYEKEHAWKIALFFGSSKVFEWLGPAIDDETNPYRQHNLMDLMSVLSVPALPHRALSLLSDPALNFERSGDDVRILPFLAATQLASSRLSMDSLELLLGASGLIGGAPFLSPVEDTALLAKWLSRQDWNGTVSLLSVALRSGSRVAKTAAARSLRLLSLDAGGSLPEHVVQALRDLALDIGERPYLRSDAVAALASAGVGRDGSFSDALAELCFHEDDRLRLTASLAILKLGLFESHRNEVQNCAYRGLEIGSLKTRPLPKGLTDQQALLIGHLAAIEPETFTSDGAAIIRHGFTLAASQTLNGILASARTKLPLQIINAVVDRIRSGETMSSASMFLFDALARLDAERLAGERWEDVWDEWMADSRQALADALLVSVFSPGSKALERRVKLLRGLLNDGAFAVRRAAARALARIAAKSLATTCEEWIRSGSIMLRARAAEAAAWLPHDAEETVDNRFQRQLAMDAEAPVRAAARRSRIELHRRVWAATHLRELSSGSPENPNDWVLRRYASGSALASTGDDASLKELRELARSADLPPNVRRWLEQVAKDLEKQWHETTQKWPEPWLPWRGNVEQLVGHLIADDRVYSADFSLWLLPPENDESAATWGGTAQLAEVGKMFAFGLTISGKLRRVRLQIEGRLEAEASIAGVNASHVILTGIGAYPDAVDAT